MGHVSYNKLMNGLTNNTITGTHLTARDVENCLEIFGPCQACLAGKRTAPSYRHQSMTEPANKVGDIIH
eukprot:5804343-Prorocentrum_lima.AAC.1